MTKINVDLLKETMNELRAIKDGKGSLRPSARFEAVKALKIIESLIEKAKQV